MDKDWAEQLPRATPAEGTKDYTSLLRRRDRVVWPGHLVEQRPERRCAPFDTVRDPAISTILRT